jgi:hypothetical protein
MYNKKRFFFFTCVHCGKWYYSWKRIKTKKCWACDKTFKFKNSKKFSKICDVKEAIAIVKELKKKPRKIPSNYKPHFTQLSLK